MNWLCFIAFGALLASNPSARRRITVRPAYAIRVSPASMLSRWSQARND